MGLKHVYRFMRDKSYIEAIKQWLLDYSGDKGSRTNIELIKLQFNFYIDMSHRCKNVNVTGELFLCLEDKREVRSIAYTTQEHVILCIQ